MKKLLLLTLSSLAVVACGGSTLTIHRYLSDPRYSGDGIYITVAYLNESSSTGSEKMISMAFTIKNNSEKKQNYVFENYKCYRESTNYGYEVGSTTLMFSNTITLEPELSSSVSFIATIPTSVTTEKYTFKSKINNFMFELHLYNSDGSLDSRYWNF